MEPLFYDLGIIVISAAVVAAVGYALKQPLIIAYIAAGILIGPFDLGLVTDLHTIHVVAQVGIMLLLFLVGLEMNYRRLGELGVVSLVAGVGQVVFTAVLGWGLATALGYGVVPATYLAVALTFSSTVIAVKILNDKNDTSSLYGQITIGILLVQDFLAILALLMLSGFNPGEFAFQPALLGTILLKGVVLAVAAGAAARFVVVRLLGQLATSHELLVLASLAWAFGVTLIAAKIGFSPEIGAFIAGISLANMPYVHEITSKAKVLRDFFITIFFVALGAGLVFTSLGPKIGTFVLLSLLVVVGNPLIVLALMGSLGYDRRTSFFTGLAIANISEFSLLVLAKGQVLGHLSPDEVSMGTVIGILTMTASSYMMVYSNTLYRWLKPYLGIFERKSVRPGTPPKGLERHIVLLGAGMTGTQVLEQIREMGKPYVVLEHDAHAVRELAKRGIPCVFGDVEDEDVLDQIGIESAELVISTIPNHEDSLFLLRQLARKPAPRPLVVVTANSGREGLELFNAGADYVILRPYLGASHIRHLHHVLYNLDEEGAQAAASVTPLAGGLHGDHEYARVLHKLNAMRLSEIMEASGR